jgi:Tfp pilus assembly protein PilO
MNRRLLIPVAIGVAVVLLWFVALWSPQGSALASAKKRRSTAEQQGATLRDQLSRLQQARRDEPLKQSELETLRVAVPDAPNLAQFILDTNDAAIKAGIQFLSITPTPPGQTGTGTTAGSTPAGGGNAPPAIRMALSISGGYFQILDFVNRLNKLPRIVVIDNLAITAGTDITKMQVSLSARMFTTSPAPVSGGGSSSTAPGATTTTTSAGATTTTRAGGG